MLLQQRLLQKVLDENYTDDGSPVVSTFKVKSKNYTLTQKYLNGIKDILQGKLEQALGETDAKFYVAGGSVLTLLMYGSPFLIRDIDLFPKTEEDYNKLKLCLDKKLDMSSMIYENNNSRSYDLGNIKFDLIKKTYSSLEVCLNNFDLNVVRVGFDENFKFTIAADISDIYNFRLKLMTEVNSSNVAQRLKRVMKYTLKGFKMRESQFVGLLATLKTDESKYQKYEGLEEGGLNINEKWEKEYSKLFSEIGPDNVYGDLEPEIVTKA